MQLIDIIIDNRIPCSFIESLDVENVIFCRPLEESLDNVSIISTKDNEFIHNYIQESANNYLETNIQLSDGRVYSGVRFKLVTIEDGKELPQSTINLSSLGKHSSISERTALSNFIEEGYDFTLNSVEDVEELVDDLRVIPVSEDISEYVEKVKSYEVHLVEEQARLATQQQELQQKEEQLKRRQSVVEVNEKIQKTLEDYKSELLTEYYTAHEKQKDILNSQFSDVSTSLFKYLGEKIRDQKTSAIELLKDLSNSNLKKLQENQNIEIERLKTEINTLLSEKLETNSDNVDKLLVERSGELQQLFSEKLVLELEEHKTNLFDEFKAVSSQTATTLFSEKTENLTKALGSILNEHRQNLNDTVTQKINEVSTSINTFKTEVDGRLPKLDKTIKDINDRINTLVLEKRNVQAIVDSAKQYTDTKIAAASQDAKDYARRILELGGGGGSVAVQYANGGTMNGNLNVTGQYLSGGVSLFAILSGSGGGGTDRDDVNTVVISNSANWINTYGSVNSLSGRWESAYTYVNANSGIEADQEAVTALVIASSANWNTAYNLLSTLTYENVEAGITYETIQEYAASNPPDINRGSTVELANGRVYVFAGTDVSNPAQYLEVNSNPVTPIYAEITLYNNNQAIVDTYYVSDFKSAKYNLQIETNFNNEIYYSEINVVAAVGSAVAVASEYGQVFTSELINSYDAEFDVNRVHLVINFSSEPTNSNHKLIVKGQRTNFYKI